MLGVGGIHSWKSIITAFTAGFLIIIIEIYYGVPRRTINPISVTIFVIGLAFVFKFEQEWDQEHKEKNKTYKNKAKK